MAAIHLAGKVHQAETLILELNAKGLQLALIPLDLLGERLRIALELLGALAGIVSPGRGCDQVELEDRLPPPAMLLHDVLDDLPNQWKRSIRLFDGEQHNEYYGLKVEV